MKRFNVSILAVIGILAIGLTAFTKAEPAGKRVVVTNCYRDLDPAYVNTCTYAPFTLTIGESCTNATAQLNKGLEAAPASFFASLDCGNAGSFFCCAKLIVDATPCLNPPAGVPVQPIVSFIDAAGTPRNARAQISQIICKTTQD